MLGLASRAGVQRSGQCALAVLGSTVAIQLLISTLSGQLVTLVNTMIDTYSLSTGAANLHWQKAAEVTLNSDILYWVLPGAVLLNLLMLACRVTRVLNMDLWSLWQAAFAGVLVQQLTGEMWYGLTAALLMVVLQIILADVFTAPVSRLTGTSHITFTQSFAVGTAPLAWLCNFLINLIPGLRDRRVSLEQSRRGNFLLEPSLWGLILGFIMGMAAGLPLYDAVSFALVAAGCLFALPRLLRVFGRAAASVLEPLTARKAYHGRLPLNVAVNAVVGHRQCHYAAFGHHTGAGDGGAGGGTAGQPGAAPGRCGHAAVPDDLCDGDERRLPAAQFGDRAHQRHCHAVQRHAADLSLYGGGQGHGRGDLRRGGI